MVVRSVVLATAVAVVIVGGAAQGVGAQVEGQSFGAAIVGAPALGVAEDGQAVLAWSGSVTTFASVRPAGGAFGARQRLSTGGNAARVFALGVGRRGDAVVVWQRTDRRGSPVGPLFARVRRASGAFHDPVRVPGSGGGRSPAAAVAPDGTLLVAWPRRAAQGCGSVVMASVARPGRSFSAAARVSGRCPSASRVRASMFGDGRGAVIWRTGRARDAYAIDAAVVGRTRIGTVRRVSRNPIVGLDIAVAASDTESLVVWRDRVSGGPRGSHGRVLSADVATDGVSAIHPVSVGTDVVGLARVTERPDGSALVAWEEGLGPTRVLAAIRSGASAPFAPPTLVDPCGATDASRTYASPALDARGSAAVIFQSACMSRFGAGPDYGIALTRRPSGMQWQEPQAVSHGVYSTAARIGAADSGELVLTWVESGTTGLRAAVIPR